MSIGVFFRGEFMQQVLLQTGSLFGIIILGYLLKR